MESFLSERISQDPLETFFCQQRQRGAVNDNPNVQEFINNTQAIRTIKGVHCPVNGNCRGVKRGRSTSVEVDKDNTFLPKRKRHKK